MKMFNLLAGLTLAALSACCKTTAQNESTSSSQQYITVLGIAQDAGYPQINNPQEYSSIENGLTKKKMVVSLGLVDKSTNNSWLFEATPDMPQQMDRLSQLANDGSTFIDGIFLTHAHIGHYTGLMYLGRESMNAEGTIVYAMPRMKSFLETNQPWKQLVDLENIRIRQLVNESAVKISPNISVIPILVPHRDEFSETVGYNIIGPKKSLLFIPDIDKWHLWNKSIIKEVKKVDYALIDATFYEEGEIPRPMSEIPHPFIEETVDLFNGQPEEVKSKIYFIHFNHSNPAINKDSPARRKLNPLGYNFADEGMILPLD